MSKTMRKKPPPTKVDKNQQDLLYDYTQNLDSLGNHNIFVKPSQHALEIEHNEVNLQRDEKQCFTIEMEMV